MQFLTSLVLLAWLRAVVGQTELSDASIATTKHREILLHDIFNGYNPKNYPTNPTINTGFSVASVDILENTRIFQLIAVFNFIWFDFRLRWDPSKYGGIQTLNVPSDNVWTPDMSIWTQAHPILAGGGQCDPTNVIISYNGEIQYFPQCTVNSFCNTTILQLYPNGPITCFFILGSWSFTSQALSVAFIGGSAAIAVDLSASLTTSGWVVQAVTGEQVPVTVSCCPAGTYSTVIYSFTLQRTAGVCYSDD